MTGTPPNPELQEALLELQQYLSDDVAPLIVADSVQLLLRYPPEAAASTIRAWTGAQYRSVSGRSVPVSDYLFHALKKIHMMGEFHLVPREPLEAYFEQLKRVVLGLCPEEDRQMLEENLARLGEVAATASPVQTIFRQAPLAEGGPMASASGASAGSGAGADAGTASSEALRNLRRFSLLLERLETQGGLGAPPRASQASPIAAEALAFAARTSHSGKELEQYLERLKSLGLDAGTDNLFRALAQSLPGWVVPASAISSDPAAFVETGTLGAMRRIITEAEDPVEAARRFHEMVKTVVERFNEGSLAQAVAMLELAERLAAEKKVDPGNVEIARRRLGETLDPERLKKFAEKPDQHEPLRRVLRFFTSLTPEGLLVDLQGEPKRDRRRLILLLLEVHGAPARAAAYEQLSRVPSTAVGEEEWFFRRNLLYLLRRIPRSAEASFDDETDLVLRHAQLGLPLVVVKEAIAALGQYKDEKAEAGLARLLADLERMLEKPEEAPYEAKDMRPLLDRVAVTIARLPTPAARRALIEHAGKKQIQLGDTMARLTELGSQNLSEDPETVDRLLALLKANLPFRLLGVTLRQNEQNLVSIVGALAGTPLPPVRRALEEIVSRLRGHDAAKAAARVLAGFDRPAAPEVPAAGVPVASLQGDLEVFGLPALLQSLAESTVSGTLTIREPKGSELYATLILSEGKLQECETGRLRGEDAFYQLLERPSPGQFAFVKGVPAKSAGALREILPLTLEAMRRYDELQETATLVSDTTFLEPSDVKPTPHPAEKDGIFLQALWGRVRQGATPRDCEEAVAGDSYRIRRALAHWVEQGALKSRGGGGA